MRARLFVAGAVLPLLLWAGLPVVSSGAPGAALQTRIDRAEQGISRKRQTEGVLTTQISGLTHRIGRLQGRVDTLQVRVSRVQAVLDDRRARLDATQTALRGQRARMVRLRARLRFAQRTLARRLVEIYESDRPDLLTVVLNAKGFAELLERMEFLGRINDQDRRVIGIVRAAKADAHRAVVRLASLERRQRRLTAEVLTRRNEIAQVRDQLVAVRSGYAAARARRQRVLGSVRVSRQHLEAEVAGLRRQQARIQRALIAAAGSTSLPASPVRGAGGGPLIWPVTGPITSPFCERRSYEACHPGLDIAAPEGTPIRAAAAGKVVLMQSTAASGGYGNYTCIQHSATMSTCYAHQERFGTSLGASVSQGQVVGYVGNTGRSFGAHLHWEVRINGAVANPLSYV